MNVVIVESPAKAKTINNYLGKDFRVLASFGHVRDLEPKDGSVRPDEDFAMSWIVDPQAKKRLADIADALKGADRLILATDPDREGEAISWHVLECLKSKRGLLKDVDVQRVAFNAITKDAVRAAIAHPRAINSELVDAYMARRALDYLVGFTLSPVLWRKLPGAKSAGRVQSVALRLICEREHEIESFRPQEYWTLEASARADGSKPFPVRLVKLDGEKIDKLSIGDEAAAVRAKSLVEAASFSVSKVETKPGLRNPSPPFTTSTLQQEAARKLGFSASRTMQIAQKLYEGVRLSGETVGLITYMRTDGVDMAPEAVAEARELIGARYGDRYRPGKPRVYKSKAKNAQEAHEAIRPTSMRRAPDEVAAHLDDDQRKLYGLIWKRTVASQMASAEVERATIELRSPDDQIGLRATGQVVTFDGFLKVYEESRDDAGADPDAEARLPKPPLGAGADVRDVAIAQHFTEPPPRFSEASLVKRLEELGIGRPSTYASILEVLRRREYVRMEKGRFIPEDKGRLVTAFLVSFFERYVEYDFTAGLEEQLDQVSAGDLDWKALLRRFWDKFSGHVGEIKDLRVSEVLETLNEFLGPYVFRAANENDDPRQCPSCGIGRLSLKTGKFGSFVGCSRYPDCRFTRPLNPDAEPEGGSAAASADGTLLGTDDETGLAVTLRSGRFGPYVQLGEQEGGEKPKRAGIPKGWRVEEMDLARALKLLRLPRDIGGHPEDGEPITAAIGRYGPYVKHRSTYANLDDPDEVFSIGLNRAVTLIAEKKEKRGKRAGPTPLRELGAHPQSGDTVAVYSGRYGPYVKHKSVNATLPKDIAPEAVTLEQAVELIAAKAGAPKKSGAKKSAAKSNASKKKAANDEAKPAAKKKTSRAKRAASG